MAPKKPSQPAATPDASALVLPRPDTFFDLTFAGQLPAILRQLARRIETQECVAQQFHCRLSRGTVEVTMTLSTEGN